MDYMLLLLNELTRKGSYFSLSPKFPQTTWPLTPSFLKSVFLISFSARKTRQIPFDSHQWSSSSPQKKPLKNDKVPSKSEAHRSTRIITLMAYDHSYVTMESLSFLLLPLYSSFPFMQSTMFILNTMFAFRKAWKESQDYSQCYCRVHLKSEL